MTDDVVRVWEYHCTAAKGERPRPERFAGASIAIVRSGMFGFRTGRRVRVLSPGFVLLGNAGQTYEVSHDHGGGDRCLVFQFHEDVLAGRCPFGTSVLPPLPGVEALAHLAEERPPALALDEIAVALAEAVSRAVGDVRGADDAPARDAARTRDLVHHAIAWLETAASGPVRLADAAAAVGLRPVPFLRMFKRETGVTPYRFVLRTRLRRAIALLRETDRPVTDIAFDVGFGDLSNFVRTFHRAAGVTPRAFRRAAKGDRAIVEARLRALAPTAT
jgi:AraC family transcriptional regulator